MNDQHVDLLLLNCSNLPWRPIFPYAFVQVSEIAKRNGIKVKRVDLLFVEDWSEKLRQLILIHQPNAVGIHLRQGDSIDLSDYDHLSPETSKYFRTYFPVEDSKRLIRIIRDIKDVPVIMGGFGFTTHARKLAQYLEIDYGVRGCPDGFFESFNNVLLGKNLSSVPGLVHMNGSDLIYNDTGYYNPAENMEYDDTIVAELKSFYGPALQMANPPTIAVEVSRGCPFQCFFCTEPDVKGKRINWRNLDVIEAELEFLLGHDLYDFWFICSELNIGGPSFALELAERVVRLGERFNAKKIRWSGYSLPSLEYDELALLTRAGYTGAMNDILSLDDENLRRAKVPYKKSQAISFLKSMIRVRSNPEVASSVTESDLDLIKYTASTPSQYSGLISFFLGNAHADKKSIARTLAALEEEGLTSVYADGYLIPATRVFDIGRTSEFVSRPTTFSYTESGEVPPDSKWPTFHFPAGLMESLGSKEAIFECFDYVSSSLMSRAHLKKKSFSRFLAQRLELPALQELLREARCHSWLSALVSGTSPVTPVVIGVESLRERLLNTTEENKEHIEKTIHTWLKQIFAEQLHTLASLIDRLGSENFSGSELTASSYRFTRSIYAKFSSMDQLNTVLDECGGIYPALFFDYLVHLTNLTIRPEYKDILFEY